MRYKPYYIVGGTISCGSILYNRHGNNFVDPKTPNYIGLKRAKEVKDGVWFIGSDSGDTYLVPEGNEFFNFYPLRQAIFGYYVYRTELNAVFGFDVSDRVQNLVLKYFFSLKL